MSTDMIEARHYPKEDIARMYGFVPHLILGADELTPGYWEDELARRIRSRGLRTRVRRVIRRARMLGR